MATAGIVAGDPDHILIAVVPDDRDPNPTLSVWIGCDAVTDVSLEAAGELVRILLGAIKVARGEAQLGMDVKEPRLRKASR